MRSIAHDLSTPALLLDRDQLLANIARMQSRITHLGVDFRPHVKTCKSIDVLRLMGGRSGVTVSTLEEARYLLTHGIVDLLYGVGITPQKMDQVAAIHQAGGQLSVIMDHLQTAELVSKRANELDLKLPCLIELDVDGDRAGINPNSSDLLMIAELIHRSSALELRGVMAHAGASYECTTASSLANAAERERALTVYAAERLRRAGLPCPVVSVGSTPTALFAENLQGVTELRAGVYVFFDLFQAGIGVCQLNDIALSVLTSVIGHQPEREYLLVDAGWMALSADRSTRNQSQDMGYGLIMDEQGSILADLYLKVVNQEHGQVHSRSGRCLQFDHFPIGTRLRVLPNHACATASQFDSYKVINRQGQVVSKWPRIRGW